MLSRPKHFISPVGQLLQAHILEPDQFDMYSLRLGLERDDAVDLQRGLQAMLERDQTSHDLCHEEDDFMVFRFCLAARVHMKGGKYWDQAPKIFNADQKPIGPFDALLMAGDVRVSGEITNHDLRLHAVQFM